MLSSLSASLLNFIFRLRGAQSTTSFRTSLNANIYRTIIVNVRKRVCVLCVVLCCCVCNALAKTDSQAHATKRTENWPTNNYRTNAHAKRHTKARHGTAEQSTGPSSEHTPHTNKTRNGKTFICLYGTHTHILLCVLLFVYIFPLQKVRGLLFGARSGNKKKTRKIP